MKMMNINEHRKLYVTVLRSENEGINTDDINDRVSCEVQPSSLEVDAEESEMTQPRWLSPRVNAC